MNRKTRILTIVIVLLLAFLLAGTFYWYSVLPTLTRKDCNKKAVANATYDDYDGWTGQTRKNQFHSIEYDEFYTACTRGKGL